jgi:hypothetical protein
MARQTEMNRKHFWPVVWMPNPLFYHSLKRRLLSPAIHSALHTWDALDLQDSLALLVVLWYNGAIKTNITVDLDTLASSDAA